MGFFNFFYGRKAAGIAAVTQPLPVEKQTVTESAGGDAPATEKHEPLTVSYASGWPIDVVYGYLHKNYEDKGFEDALVKSDLGFKDMNLGIIRNKILMVFREINLRYDVMGEDLRIRMDNCSAAGLLSTVSELDKRMQIVAAHKKELGELEANFRNNTSEAAIPLQSYECGFLRGIATAALGGGKQQKETVR